MKDYDCSAFQSFLKKQKGLRQTPRGYMCWESYLADLARRVADQIENSIGTEYNTVLTQQIEALTVLQVPPRYVNHDIQQAWCMTRIPRLSHNNPYVLPGYVLFLPIPQTKRDWQEVQKISPSTVAMYAAIMVLHSSKGLMTHYVVAEWEEDRQTCRTYVGSILVSPDVDYNDVSLSPETKAIALLAVNSWLVHAYEPELIEEAAAPSESRGFGRKPGKPSPIAPTWIGRNFKIRRESAPSTGQETGIKVRPHWRSGHWHTVRHGKGKEQTRTQWYRPTYVNADV